MSSNSYIPEEIMIDIFSRLPCKSVGRFRCLSKSWSFHLSAVQFVNLHLSCKTHQENIILINGSLSLCTITSPVGIDSVSKKIELQNSYLWTDVVGSCNGLVLVANMYDNLLCLVNPVTAEKVNIPNVDLPLKPDYNDRVYGFGYDSCTDDYKIVSLSNIYREARVDVCSVKSGVWKERVGIFPFKNNVFPYNNTVVPHGSGALVGRVVHLSIRRTWSTRRAARIHPTRIVAFDLATEVFYEIPFPLVDYDWSDRNNLCLFGGCLCLIDNPSRSGSQCMSDSRSYIWMMKEYGVVESWTRICVESRGKWEIRIPFYFIGVDKEEIVLLTYDNIVVVYNLQKKATREIAVDGVVAGFDGEHIFVDSLVSPTRIAEKSKDRGRMTRVGD